MYIGYPLKLPFFDCKIKKELGKVYILDKIRKKYLLLTPEEWVRQHMVNYLINHCAYPPGWFRLEKKIRGIMPYYRPDMVLCDPRGAAKMIIECKAPSTSLHTTVLGKMLQYNRQLAADFLLLTNGRNHFCWKLEKTTHQVKSIIHIPTYRELIA